MTKESGGRKRKGRKGRKGKGHIIIYTCARERGKGRLKDGSHMQEEEEGTRRGDGDDTGLNTKEEWRQLEMEDTGRDRKTFTSLENYPPRHSPPYRCPRLKV